MKKKDLSAPPERPGPVVYCGPTIPGAARQYTVYRGGIPVALAEAAEENPALGGLILPLERLPEARRSISQRSGPIYRLFCQARTKNAKEA